MIEQIYKGFVHSKDRYSREVARLEELLTTIEKEQGWSHLDGMDLRREARKEEEDR